jgi:aminomethyltransferase
MKKTSLYDVHVNAGAKMVEFGGFLMPVQYSGIRKEHLAVREQAGLFDVSHMGEVMVSGPDALAFVQKITVNDASVLTPGKAQYSAMCYENGTIVDDLLVYRLSESSFMLVINASNIEKDVAWMKQHLTGDVLFEDVSENMCLLALQGPIAADILEKCTTSPVRELGYYTFLTGNFCGVDGVIISATGYTGEKGFEIYFDGRKLSAEKAWNALIEAGAEYGLIPAGLGARDTLRLEMGFALYGNDISDQTNTLEAGLGWITKLKKDDFIGKSALLNVQQQGISRKLIGFTMKDERAIPRSHYPVCTENGVEIGEVTSGGQSIINGKGIGMAYVPIENAPISSRIFIRIREKLHEAEVVKPPFIKK